MTVFGFDVAKKKNTVGMFKLCDLTAPMVKNYIHMDGMTTLYFSFKFV